MADLNHPALQLAVTAWKKSNYTQAVKLFKEIPARDMNEIEPLYAYGISCFHVEDHKTAAWAFRRIIEAGRDGFYLMQSYMLLGYIYAQQNELALSEDYLHELLKRNFENAQIYAILGYIYNKRKDFAQAEYYYKKSISLEPSNPNSHNGMGYNYLEWNKHPEKALEHIQKAVEYDADHPAYLDSLGWYYFVKKSFSKSLFYLTKALRIGRHKVIEEHLREARKNVDTKNPHN